jgi:FkbM family methyltransferase
MLINFNYLVEKYGKPKGIIHIGAHLLEERNYYLSNGIENIIWIEANPKIFESGQQIINNSSTEKIFNFAVSNIDDEIVELNVTNNGQSSSILELDLHKHYYPHIVKSESAYVKTKKIISLFSENSLDIEKYDFLNIDIQGAELLALKGFEDLLKKVNFIYTEVNTNFLYKNCALLSEIDEYLLSFGFHRVEIHMTEYEWGDAFYIKNV